MARSFPSSLLAVCAFVTLSAGVLAFEPGTCRAQDGVPKQVKEPQVHEGMVVSVSANQVAMKAADGKEHSFKIDTMTRVTINGKPGKLTDLQPGMPIRIMVDQAGKVTSVSTVDDRK